MTNPGNLTTLIRQRYTGLEDEFRVATDGRPIYVDELISGSRRFFFDESGHVPILEPRYEPDSIGGRIWTWYGGTLYHDYDAIGTLIEATTPLTALDAGIEALVDNVLTQRAQLLEAARGKEIVGVSTHVNLTLDSDFQGRDLCEISTRIPSNAFAYAEAPKLGADVALLATHTISPILAYLLFNYQPAKGAHYRPRRNRRIELCLPYVPDPDQMRAGFLFWFSSVDYFTDLIKSDLAKLKDWGQTYEVEDYYKRILSKFPYALTGVKFKRPSYYIGYQIDGGEEARVMEDGSKAMISTCKGDIKVTELAKVYVDLISDRLGRLGNKKQTGLLQEFLNRKRSISVDFKGIPKFLRLDESYLERFTGRSTNAYLNEHKVDELASKHLRFVHNPFRIIKPFTRALPEQITRNLTKELDWNFIRMEILQENEDRVRRYLIEVPLEDAEGYLALEDAPGNPEVFLSEIEHFSKTLTEMENPRSLFAYGTLMNPETDRRVFHAAVTTIKGGHAYGESYDFSEYPVLIENYGASVVPGVLLNFTNFTDAIRRLDIYEGCIQPNPIFIRALREVVLDDGERLTAWIYVGNKNNSFVREKIRTAHRVPGVWKKATLRRTSVPFRA